MKFYTAVALYGQVWLKYVYGKWQNYAVSTKTNPISQRSSVMQNWLKANGSIEKNEWPQRLQIWARGWTTTSAAPCSKNTINSSGTLRRLISWNSPRRWEELPQNTLTRRWRTLPRTWLPTWDTVGICSNSVRLQICILISSTNRLLLEPPSGVIGGGADRPGWHPPRGDTRRINNFVGKFTKNSGQTRSDR